MKHRVLAMAVRQIVWAEIALAAMLAVPAFAQSQPAVGPAAVADALAFGPAINVAQADTPSSVGAATAAAPTGSNKVQQIKRFEVTGSLIRSLDKVGFNQVQTITLKEITSSGATTVADFLRNTTANSANSWSEGQSSSFAAGIALRGLHLDGSLGSAINSGNGDGTTKFGMLSGFGDLNADRFNVTVAASYYKFNGFTLADRDSTRNQDFTGSPGGLLVLAPSYWNLPGGNAQALAGCPSGSTARPAGTNSLAATNGLGGTVCGLNTAESMSILPMTERLNAKLHGDFEVDDKTTAFGDFMISSISSTSNQGTHTIGNPQGPALIWNPVTQQLSPFNTIVPASNPFNTTGVPLELTYTFPNVVAEKTTSTFWRTSTGVKGSFGLPIGGDWDWVTSLSHSQSTVSNSFSNELNVNALNNIYQNGTLNFANPSSTPNAFNGLYQDASTFGISKLDTIDATLSTPMLFHLPTDDVGLGLGAQFTHQSEFLSPGSEFADGLVSSPNLQTVNGQRNVAAVYYQLNVPILKNLAFSQSSRYDHYSDVGGAFSPRFALRYQPAQQLTLYTSYSRGFRAPTFVEDSASRAIGSQVDSATGQNYRSIMVGNPNISPEHTRNLNIGFQPSPSRYTDFSLDWYKIRVDNVIGQGSPTQIVNDPNTGALLYKITPYTNLGYLDTNGFESTFRQTLPLKSFGTLTLSGDWVYVKSFKISQPGAAPVDGVGSSAAALRAGAAIPRWTGAATAEMRRSPGCSLARTRRT